MAEGSSGNGSALRAFAITAFLLNIVLASGMIYLYSQNRELENLVNQALLENQNLTNMLLSLSKEYNMTRSQLEYYKRQAEHLLEQYGAGKPGWGLTGNATANIVAVRLVQESLFTTYYEGVAMKVSVELMGGAGRVLISTQPRIGIDLQASARTAAFVAQAFTGISLNMTDVIITVSAESEVDVVDGESAGAAITAALIAAIRGTPLNELIFMTGTIMYDGSIGPVGAVLEKAVAAAKRGATEFLVPRGQSIVTAYEEEVTRRGPFVLIIRRPYTVSLQAYLKEQGYSVVVREVGTISEAYEMAVRR